MFFFKSFFQVQLWLPKLGTLTFDLKWKGKIKAAYDELHFLRGITFSLGRDKECRSYSWLFWRFLHKRSVLILAICIDRFLHELQLFYMKLRIFIISVHCGELVKLILNKLKEMGHEKIIFTDEIYLCLSRLEFWRCLLHQWQLQLTFFNSNSGGNDLSASLSF